MEAAYSKEVADDETPERLFERTWAREVLQVALDEVGAELAAEGKDLYFRVLQERFAPEGSSYEAIAERLDLSVGDVGNYLHRARQRFRQALLRAVLPSVSGLADADREIGELLGALEK